MAAEDNAPLPPQNLNAEESILGAMIQSSVAIDSVLDTGIAARDYYRPSHGRIHDAIVSLYSLGQPVDEITVADKLAEQGRLEDAGGVERIHDLTAFTPSVSNARHWARIVKEMATLRALITAGEEIARLGRDRPGEIHELVEKAERAIFTLALSGRTGDFIPLAEPLADTFRKLDAMQTMPTEVVGVPSGFKSLDAMTSGFEPGNLIIVAARPSMGKSGFGLNVAAHLAVGHGRPVGLFTLEMSRSEVTGRVLSAEAMVDSRHIRNGKLSGEEWDRLMAAGARLHTAPLQIDDSGAITAMELRAKARRLKMRQPDLALIVVDYIQLMTSGSSSDNRQQDVSQTSRALKVLAGELNVPVIALSQLSRQPEQRHDKRPVLSDLRESGSIEQDADVVLFLYRDEYYHPDDTDQEGIAEVNIAKHRNGPTGTVKLAFVKRYTRFGDLQE